MTTKRPKMIDVSVYRRSYEKIKDLLGDNASRKDVALILREVAHYIEKSQENIIYGFEEYEVGKFKYIGVVIQQEPEWLEEE